jgi:hypothetical protein
MKKILLFLIVIIFSECKESAKPELSSVYAVNIFSTGSITRNNQEFKIMNLLKEKEELLLSPRSFCDLQIAGQDWLLRAYGEGKFKLDYLKTESTEDWVLYLQEGILFAKINQKLKAKESFKIKTPTATLGIRGTQFKIEVAKDGTTKINIIDGKVAVELTPSSNNLKNHSEISPLLEKSEILLEKDKSLDIDQKFWKSLETMSSVEKEKFPETFNQTSSKFISIVKPEIKTQLEKEFANISGLPLTAFKDEATLGKSIEDRIKENSKELLQLMGKVSTKKKGTIVLQSGEEIPGLIEKKDKNIIIETPLKTMNFQESEVLEISYE